MQQSGYNLSLALNSHILTPLLLYSSKNGTVCTVYQSVVLSLCCLATDDDWDCEVSLWGPLLQTHTYRQAIAFQTNWKMMNRCVSFIRLTVLSLPACFKCSLLFIHASFFLPYFISPQLIFMGNSGGTWLLKILKTFHFKYDLKCAHSKVIIWFSI